MTNAVTTHLEVRRLNTTFAAEVRGIDLSAPLDDVQRAEIWNLLVENKVLFFPEQNLDSDSQVAFAKQFGDLTGAHPVMDGLDEDHPEIWEIDSYGSIRNDIWHTDVTFVKKPPLGSVLRAVNVPEVGGDTLWGDQEAAYNNLSPALQQLVDGLVAIHDGSASFGAELAKKNGESNDWDGVSYTQLAPVEHPVVRVHPETGRKALFVNSEFTTSIKGLSRLESKHLLDLLFAHSIKPEHVVKHQWNNGDVVLWDNRNTIHYASYDYGNFHRKMQRVTWHGDEPRGV